MRSEDERKVTQSSPVKRLIQNEGTQRSQRRVEVPLHLPAFVTDLCSPPMKEGMCHFLEPRLLHVLNQQWAKTPRNVVTEWLPAELTWIATLHGSSHPDDCQTFTGLYSGDTAQPKKAEDFNDSK